MEKKYKLTDETIEVEGKALYRIEALKDFCEIKKGDKGGFIESEDNLSHEGNAWVYDDARVYDNSWVYDHALGVWKRSNKKNKSWQSTK